jgi:hypothetical protein
MAVVEAEKCQSIELSNTKLQEVRHHDEGAGGNEIWQMDAVRR